MSVDYYLDIHGNSRANTCIKAQPLDGPRLLELNQYLLVNHNNCADRMGSSRRQINRVSALSALDGRVLAYHGVNG